jgi:hypothetical protein
MSPRRPDLQQHEAIKDLIKGPDQLRYEKVRYPPFAWRTVITFFDAQDRVLGLSFIPARPERVRRALTDFGWPVQVERLGIRGRRRDTDTTWRGGG